MLGTLGLIVPKLFDFSAVTSPFRMQPGMRRLAPGSRQLTPADPAGAHLREKLQVLRTRPQTAMLKAEGFDPGAALEALRQQAIAEGISPALHNAHPDVNECVGRLDSQWQPAARLSLAFEEDFAILDGNTGCIPWMAVCLPSQWAPEEKIGLHFAQVHAPVADNQLLLAASEHLLRLATDGSRWERFVWTITPHSRLSAHPAHTSTAGWQAQASAAQLAEAAFFRSERQTFIPVAGAPQAVFTIHVEVDPLADLVDSPSKAKQLHDALSSMSPAVLAYRRLTDARDRLMAWLAFRAA